MNTTELINKFREEVKNKNLSDKTNYNYNKTLIKIENYFCNLEFNYENCQKFLSDIIHDNDFRYVLLKNYKEKNSYLIRIIRYLYFYKYHNIIPVNYCGHKKHVSDENNKILLEYLAELKEKGRSELSLRNYRYHFVYFFNYLENNNLSIKNIKLEIVKDYINSLTNLSLSSKHDVCKHFKTLIKFLYDNSYINSDFSLLIPQTKLPKYSPIPSVWSKDEISMLLNSYDLDTSLGKRNYAIVLLALNLGIRWCDIKNLKFENFNWNLNIIRFKQVKTNICIELPISEDIGNAIIDYIKNGRPLCNEPYIFVTHLKPYRQMSKTFIPTRNLNVKFNHKKGIHSLRHTLASNLLKEETPLNIISSILGHVNSDTTTIYLKIDEKNLRNCFLSLKGVNIDE